MDPRGMDAVLRGAADKYQRQLARRGELPPAVIQSPPGVAELVPHLRPQLLAPYPLAPLLDVLERAKKAAAGEGPPVFACTHCPPQHGKTTLLEVAISGWLRDRPQDFLAYLSYGAKQAQDKSRSIRRDTRALGVQLRDDTQAVDLWRTTAGGGLLADGLEGGITGKSALRCIIIDDPYKNLMEARSPVVRRKRWLDFQASVWSRRHRNTSVIINHTRWHVKDLQGQVLSDEGRADLGGTVFEHVVMPAVQADGSALWPEVQPLEVLRGAMGNAYLWAAMYLGQPVAEGAGVFQGVTYWDVLPSWHRIAIGVDLAYSAKSSADWSVAVVLAESAGRYYVLNVIRRQCEVGEFMGELRALHTRYPGAPIRWYRSGTEKGTSDLAGVLGVPIDARNATADKMVRALPASVAWNEGRIAMPRSMGRECHDFLSCVQDFTGVGDPHDDDVDALAAAYDALPAQSGTGLRQPALDRVDEGRMPSRRRRGVM